MDILVENVKKKSYLVFLIKFFNQSITTIIYLLYPLILIYLGINKDMRGIALFFIPLIFFVLLSFIRKKINGERPYVIYNYEPILKREKPGESFPSRHVFSIFIISTGIYTIFPKLGIILLVFGVILALCRFLGGVHFFKDVFVGALCGILPWVLWALMLQ